MKRFLQALALTCVLSGVVLAGDIPTVGAPAPAPNGITQTEPTALPGDIPTVDSTSPGDIPTVGLSVFLTILDLVF
jgi:hypothetical protein